MAKVQASVNGTKVTTGEVRLSYCNLFVPTAMTEGAPKKYSVSVIIDKNDKDTLQAIEKAIAAAKEKKWGNKVPKKCSSPLHDGDIDREDDQAYEGCYYLNAKSNNKPGVVDNNVQPILDATEVYSGCYGRLTLSFYGYDNAGNIGVGCGLGNVQKLHEGEPLGGVSNAANDFDVVELEDDFFDAE